MENELLCPNCGYQVKSDDYYCPSCKHRLDTVTTVARTVETRTTPAQYSSLAGSLIVSSAAYIISIALVSAQYFISIATTATNADLYSMLLVVSTLFSGVSAFLLAIGAYRVSGALRLLRNPSIMLFLLGAGNILLLIALLLIYPSSTTLSSILNQLGNPGSTQTVALAYGPFFALLGIAGIIGLVGLVGLLMVIHRSSRALSQPLIYYGLILGIVMTFVEALAGIPALVVLAPILIIIGARRSKHDSLITN